MCTVGSAGESARSRQMLRAPWSTGASEEESRAYLHARVMVLWRLMFWCFLALVVFLACAYTVYPHVQPERQELVYIAFAFGLVVIVLIRRIWLVRPKLSIRALEAIDTVYLVGALTTIAFCAATFLALEPGRRIAVPEMSTHRDAGQDLAQRATYAA